ncbi:YqgQ family protein [Vagococcus coleopterorum]|uniref:YqgQ family protein n=1 Tax=Vagococcus coleopterorum TaxID=2714946 RepID=A0A6G8AMX2_9ENTE|nr:YqgQ family protein [Vagococcus coleopterorum]QIL46275.1 YqgQ family protein [Vagococcus coleopterorum]
METLYDVQQLLKRYGTYIYVGKRKWDIEMMGIELDSLYRAQILDIKSYQAAKVVLIKEHEHEVRKENSSQTGI